MGACCSNSSENQKEINSDDQLVSRTPGGQGGEIRLNAQQLAALIKVQSFFR